MLIKRFINRIISISSWFSKWCRICGSAAFVLLVRTKKRQWRDVAYGGPPSWDDRNVIISSFIPDGSSVLDVGCGAQTLKRHLKSGCSYQPCDLVKSTEDVIVCDFNAGIYPDKSKSFDYVVCSGVLEYVHKPKEFLQRIPTLGRITILSYNPMAPGGSRLERLGNGWGWVNHFTRLELESIFSELELKANILHIEKLAYIIYSLEKVK